MDLRETYDKIGEDWHRDHQHDDWWVEATNAFVAFLGTGARVLDAGCGAGVKSRYLAERGLNVLGIDFSTTQISIARRTAFDAEFRVMDMRFAGMLPETFDGIFAQASLLHIPRDDLASVVRRLANRLKPGGYFYIAVKGPQPGQPLEEVKEECDYGFPYRRFFAYYAPADIETAFAAAQIETVFQEVKRAGKTDWVQLIGRLA